MKTLVTALLLAAGLACPVMQSPASPLAPTKPTAMLKKKITTCLWFNDNAEQAIRFYAGIFADTKILSESRWGDGGTLPKGTLLSARFTLCGQEFMVINGGPIYRLSEAVSLTVDCDTQAEIDSLWSKLTADGGEESQCGWLKDKFGLSWQITPSSLGTLLDGKDPAKAQRVGAALMQMHKIDIATLEKAAAGR